MGFAKQKMFGKRSSQWPILQRLVDQGILLDIDLAYAKLKTENEEKAATYAALLALARQGHLCLKKENIVDPQLAEMVQEGAHLPKYAYFENQIVTNIKRLLSYPTRERIQTSEQLNDKQNKALTNALKYPLSLITGGPGTGKTFTAAKIVHSFNTKTILAAPTGKAAAHLESKVEMPVRSGTLHSFLKVQSPLDYAKEVNPLDASLVVVDECSMIDPPLFGRLLASIGPETTLVLMGDRNQLPAVEGGSVFADLIDSQIIPVTTLTKCMRSDRDEILQLASSILQQEAKDIRNIDLGFEEGDLVKIYHCLWELVKTRDFNHFRILSTLRKGPLGVDALNTFFYEKFSELTDQFPILIKRNDRRTGLCNGDTGILIRGKEALFSQGRCFPIHELPSYEYAYCISVHKSQGSEYEHVLFLVPEGSEVFGREVLYTAVTRAKIKLEIDGSLKQILTALGRTSGKVSGICDKLKR